MASLSFLPEISNSGLCSMLKTFTRWWYETKGFFLYLKKDNIFKVEKYVVKPDVTKIFVTFGYLNCLVSNDYYVYKLCYWFFL